MAGTSTDLAVRRTPVWRLLGALVLAVGLIGFLAWQANHPGVAAGVPGRTLHLSGVKIHTTSNTDVSVTPLLCRDGRIEATTDPAAFCADLVNPEGQAFGPTDSIVLQVLSAVPAVAVIDPVRLGFRENLQWGTFPTGAGAVVQVLAR